MIMPAHPINKREQASQFMQVLRDVIHNDFHIENVGDEIIFKETKEQASCKKVILKSSPMHLDTFAFSIDQERKQHCGDPIYSFFDCSPCSGLCKKNDGIVFVRKNSDIHVFLIELKSSSGAKYIPQLKAAKLFVEYVLALLELSDCHTVPMTSIRCIRFLGRRSPQKGTSRHAPLVFERRNDLDIIDWSCSNLFPLLATFR